MYVVYGRDNTFPFSVTTFAIVTSDQTSTVKMRIIFCLAFCITTKNIKITFWTYEVEVFRIFLIRDVKKNINIEKCLCSTVFVVCSFLFCFVYAVFPTFHLSTTFSLYKHICKIFGQYFSALAYYNLVFIHFVKVVIQRARKRAQTLYVCVLKLP